VNLEQKQAAMLLRRGKEPDPVAESKIRVSIYLLWRAGVEEEELARRFDRPAGWMRDFVADGFPLM